MIDYTAYMQTGKNLPQSTVGRLLANTVDQQLKRLTIDQQMAKGVNN